MSCYHPMLAEFNGYSVAGKPTYKITSSWCGITHDPRDIRVPCGHCIGCRLDKSRQWADRMMLELDHSKTAVFVTLTYDSEHVPLAQLLDDGTWLYTLNKRDLQLFLKRLRKYFSGKEIRFYAAGEYGDTTSRPHYHAILFGLSLLDFPDVCCSGHNAFGQEYYCSDILQRIWSNGFVSLSSVSWQTCAYVSRYVTKKLDGDMSIVYEVANQTPPFALMSRRPGIAGYFADDHPELLSERMQYVHDPHGQRSVNKIPTPKYIFSKLEDIDPELYRSIKSQRSQYANDKFLMEMQNTDLDELDYLSVKEYNKLVSVRGLSRNKL